MNGSTKPSKFDWTYTEKDIIYRGGTKSIRIDGEDTIYASVSRYSAILQIDGDTGELEHKSGIIDPWTQTNDIELAEDGGIVLVGHYYDKSPEGCKTPNGCTRIRAAMIKVDDQYKVQWNKLYGNYPGGTNQFAGLTEGPWP